MNNVEKIVISWLESYLTDAWAVFGDRPNQTPEGYVLVDRTGGKRESKVLDKAEILLEVYHKTSRVAASDKASELGDVLDQLLNYESITRAEVNSTIKLDDTINQEFRYQVYCNIWCRR